jgi:hypothetical protein
VCGRDLFSKQMIILSSRETDDMRSLLTMTIV